MFTFRRCSFGSHFSRFFILRFCLFRFCLFRSCLFGSLLFRLSEKQTTWTQGQKTDYGKGSQNADFHTEIEGLTQALYILTPVRA